VGFIAGPGEGYVIIIIIIIITQAGRGKNGLMVVVGCGWLVGWGREGDM